MYTYRTLERPQMTTPHKRRLPDERHLQALDLPQYRQRPSFYANDEYATGSHFTAPPLYVTYDHRDKNERDLHVARTQAIADYDDNMPQTPSRSWSMIDLTSVRRRQTATRMKGGANGDRYSCENNEADNDTPDFFFRGREQPPPDSPEFLTVGNSYQPMSSQRQNHPGSIPFRPQDTFSSDPLQQRRNMPQRRLDFSPSTNVSYDSGSCSCPRSPQVGQSSMDRYRNNRSSQSQQPPSMGMPSPGPAAASSGWQPQMPRHRQGQAITDLQMGRTFDYSVPYRQVQTAPGRANGARKSSQWDAPYRQQTPTFMREYEPYQPSFRGMPIYANVSQPEDYLPSNLDSYAMSGSAPMGPSSLGIGTSGLGASCMGSAGMGASGMGSSGMGASGMGASGMGASGMGASGMGASCMESAGMGSGGMGSGGMGSGGMGASGADASCMEPPGMGGDRMGNEPCPPRGRPPKTPYQANTCLATSGQDPCARQNIVPRCPPKQPPEKCSTEREAMECAACGVTPEESTGKQCVYFNPKIAAKMDKCLPAFSVPRGMEEDFNCKKRRELWDNLVRDANCPGAIQDTVDNVEDFNLMAMDIVFGNSRIPDTLPCDLDPVTLLEAFYMRINYERCQIKKIEDTLRQDDQAQQQPEPNDDVTQIEKCFKRKYQTEVNAAIEKFLKAEKIFNFVNPEPESATMTLSVDKITTDVPGVPIKLNAYTGITKPKNP